MADVLDKLRDLFDSDEEPAELTPRERAMLGRDESERRIAPPPRPELEQEPSHRAARIADRDRGEERGDGDER